jgi:hypothetical protein
MQQQSLVGPPPSSLGDLRNSSSFCASRVQVHMQRSFALLLGCACGCGIYSVLCTRFTINPLTNSILRTCPPRARHVSPSSSTGRHAKSSKPRSTHTFTVLTRSTLSLPYLLALVDVPSISHRSWSLGLRVPRSKPHIRPSPCEHKVDKYPCVFVL